MSDSHIYTCPHCHSKNKVPVDRNIIEANCGNCHKQIVTGQVVETDASQFQNHLAQDGMPVIADFWAGWCAPCQAVAPVYKALAEEFKHKLRFVKVDTDIEQRLAGQYQIRGLPTFVIFNQGQEISRMSGAMALEQFRNWILNTLN